MFPERTVCIVCFGDLPQLLAIKGQVYLEHIHALTTHSIRQQEDHASISYRNRTKQIKHISRSNNRNHGPLLSRRRYAPSPPFQNTAPETTQLTTFQSWSTCTQPSFKVNTNKLSTSTHQFSAPPTNLPLKFSNIAPNSPSATTLPSPPPSLPQTPLPTLLSLP